MSSFLTNIGVAGMPKFLRKLCVITVENDNGKEHDRQNCFLHR